MELIFILLLLLQLKHIQLDFMVQTDEEIICKGIYGHCIGINHSLKHGIGTFIVLFLCTGFKMFALISILSFLNFIIHYHIDYIKMNYGETNVNTTRYWQHLGLGQLIHQLTYLLIVYIVSQHIT